MSDLAQMQSRVLDELYAPVFKPGGLDDLIDVRPERLEIYRDNLVFGLSDVLGDLFEITRTVAGEDAFALIARGYISSHPQGSGDRNLYGADLADFLARHETLKGQMWISDLARLEWAMHLAHHADDAEALAFDQMLGDAAIALHPSAQLIEVSHNVFALSQAYHADALAGFEVMPETSTLMIWRDPDDQVLCRALSDAEAHFVCHFQTSAPLGDILSTLPEGALPPLQLFLGVCVPAGLFIEARPL